MLISFWRGEEGLFEAGCSLTFWRGEEGLTRGWVPISFLEGGGGFYLRLGAH